MSSARLPGKVLKRLAGKPMLAWLLERMLLVETVPKVVVATSDREDDDGVASLAEAMNVLCFRGSVDDVLGRFLGAALQYRLDAVARVNGDSPFLDPGIVREAVQLFTESDVDIVTNVYPRSFPKGQSVEVIATAALQRAAQEASAEEREHVTTHFYARPDDYRILNFAMPRPRPEIQMSVDTEADFAIAEAMLHSMSRAPREYDLESLLELRMSLVPMTETPVRQ